MKYLATTCLMAIVIASPLIAQEEPATPKPSPPRERMRATVPIGAVMENKRLSGATKVAYVLRQIRLNEEQKAHASELVATLYANQEEPQLDLAKVHSIVAEIQKAKQDGDEKLAAELGQQLRDLARQSDDDEEFMLNMETVLSETQKLAMHEAYDRLERNPSGAIRPVDVIRAAGELDLTSEQRARVDKTAGGLRAELRKNRARKLDDEWRFRTINAMIHTINEALTEQQRVQFKGKIRGLRSDIAINSMTQLPDSTPERND